MTLAFWVRLLRGEETRRDWMNIIGQGPMGAGGITITVKPEASTLCMYIELNANRWRCCFDDIPANIYRHWVFMSMAFDPAPSSKMICFMNENRIEVGMSSITAGDPLSVFFGGNEGKFMLDDIFCVPNFLNDEMIQTFYNNSKFLLH